MYNTEEVLAKAMQYKNVLCALINNSELLDGKGVRYENTFYENMPHKDNSHVHVLAYNNLIQVIYYPDVQSTYVVDAISFKRNSTKLLIKDELYNIPDIMNLDEGNLFQYSTVMKNSEIDYLVLVSAFQRIDMPNCFFNSAGIDLVKSILYNNRINYATK